MYVSLPSQILDLIAVQKFVAILYCITGFLKTRALFQVQLIQYTIISFVVERTSGISIGTILEILFYKFIKKL